MQNISKDPEIKINDREYISVDKKQCLFLDQTTSQYLHQSEPARQKRLKSRIEKLFGSPEGNVCPQGEPLPNTSEEQTPLKVIPTDLNSNVFAWEGKAASVCPCLQYCRCCQKRGVQPQTYPVPPPHPHVQGHSCQSQSMV